MARLGNSVRRRRFATGRAQLRRLVDAPQGIDFALNANGKPSLPGALHFSFSAAGDVALIGICQTSPIGVDIERIRDLAIESDWPERHPALAAMRRGAERYGDSDATQFLRAWTRLEAATKRDGGRLGNALRENAAITPDAEGVFDIDLTPDLIAAVAVSGTAAICVARPEPNTLLRG